MGALEIVALIAKWLAIAEAAGPGAQAALEQVKKLVAMLGGLATKKPSAAEIAAVQASSKALTDAINATP